MYVYMYKYISNIYVVRGCGDQGWYFFKLFFLVIFVFVLFFSSNIHTHVSERCVVRGCGEEGLWACESALLSYRCDQSRLKLRTTLKQVTKQK